MAINIPAYALFWRDRIKQIDGGVCLYVRSDLKVSMKEDLVDGECDGAEAIVSMNSLKTKVVKQICYLFMRK